MHIKNAFSMCEVMVKTQPVNMGWVVWRKQNELFSILWWKGKMSSPQKSRCIIQLHFILWCHGWKLFDFKKTKQNLIVAKRNTVSNVSDYGNLPYSFLVLINVCLSFFCPIIHVPNRSECRWRKEQTTAITAQFGSQHHYKKAHLTDLSV